MRVSACTTLFLANWTELNWVCGLKYSSTREHNRVGRTAIDSPSDITGIRLTSVLLAVAAAAAGGRLHRHLSGAVIMSACRRRHSVPISHRPTSLAVTRNLSIRQRTHYQQLLPPPHSLTVSTAFAIDSNIYYWHICRRKLRRLTWSILRAILLPAQHHCHWVVFWDVCRYAGICTVYQPIIFYLPKWKITYVSTHVVYIFNKITEREHSGWSSNFRPSGYWNADDLVTFWGELYGHNARNYQKFESVQVTGYFHIFVQFWSVPLLYSTICFDA